MRIMIGTAELLATLRRGNRHLVSVSDGLVADQRILGVAIRRSAKHREDAANSSWTSDPTARCKAATADNIRRGRT
jgi:hypothetical protein